MYVLHFRFFLKIVETKEEFIFGTVVAESQVMEDAMETG